MPSLVIFDMDGVLVDSEPLHVEIERELLAGLSVPDTLLHDAFVGMAPRDMWTIIKSQCALPQTVDWLVAHEAEFKTRAFAAAALHAIDGVETLLRDLAQGGHALAIASSSPTRLIDTVTDGAGLRRYFQACVSAEDVACGKPHPDIFLEAARLCNAAPGDCVVVEDSGNGVRAAVAAGMRCIGFVNPNSGNQDLSAAALRVHDFGRPSIRRILDFVERRRA